MEESSAEEITSEIVELARDLNHDPKLIYEYVRNHVDYVPYFGSLKGAAMTYFDGAGNDFDQASLMIALLRKSGYQAQYVYGRMLSPYYG
ncbi:transglutaminase-like domain-containing protein [uncultured Desulfobacter sp.]|uniref:transglutaminase-like domain-containing protein n=1 Tax=uncultured Desulfobacter sp. TaxID=240139 RepID=UPI002AA68880|nr:transglutaminase-like domain-containing protein [uncultured Desulfobacter sp.]